MRPTLVIFAKDPRTGQVKTRLGREIGQLPATWWYRRTLARLIRRVSSDPRWETVLAVAPDRAVASPLLVRAVLGQRGLRPRPTCSRTPPRYLGRKEERDEAGEAVRLPRRCGQGRGDLGERMARALFAFGTGPVFLIGSDIPGIDRGHVAHAFAELRESDAVLGPAADGGFWGVGLAQAGRPVATLFNSVRWSGPQTMADTIRSMAGLRIAFTETLSDVDCAADLRPGDLR